MRRYGAGEGRRIGFVTLGTLCGLLSSRDVLAQNEPSKSFPTLLTTPEHRRGTASRVVLAPNGATYVRQF
jgi:hypothetical protein